MKPRLWIPLALLALAALVLVLRPRRAELEPVQSAPAAPGELAGAHAELESSATSAARSDAGAERPSAAQAPLERRLRVIDRPSGKPLPDAVLSRLRTAKPDPSHPDERRLWSLRPMTDNYPDLAVLGEEACARSDAEGFVDAAALGEGRFLARHAGYATQFVNLKSAGLGEASEDRCIELLPCVALNVRVTTGHEKPVPGVHVKLVRSRSERWDVDEDDRALRTTHPGLDQEPMLLGSPSGMAGPSDENGRLRVEGVPCAITWALYASAGARGGVPRLDTPCGRDVDVAFEAAGTGTIRGRLVTESGVPVAEGSVWATTRGELAFASAHASADGRFEFQELVAGTVRLKFDGLEIDAREVELAPGEVRDLGTIACPDLVTLAGEVLVCPALPRESIKLLLAGSRGASRRLVALEGDGRFRTQVRKGDLRVAAIQMANGRWQILCEQAVTEYEGIVLDARTACATLHLGCEGLADGTQVKARLLTRTGPLPFDPRNVPVHPFEIGTFRVDHGSLSIVTAARGEFELYLTAGGDLGAWIAELRIERGQDLDLGRVAFGRATLDVRCSAELLANSVAHDSQSIPAASAAGASEVSLLPGRWTLGSAGQGCLEPRTLELQAGERRAVEVDSRRASSIHGALVHGGSPASGAIVRLYELRRRMDSRELATDERGAFAFDGLGEGTYHLVVGPIGESLERVLEVGCGEDVSLVLDVDGSTVPVRFVRDGVELPIARAVAVDLDPGSPSFGCARAATRDGEGRWALRLTGKRVLLRAFESWRWPQGWAWIGSVDELRATGTVELAGGRLEIELDQPPVFTEVPRVLLAQSADGLDLASLSTDPLVTEDCGGGRTCAVCVPPGVQLVAVGRLAQGHESAKRVVMPASGRATLAWP